MDSFLIDLAGFNLLLVKPSWLLLCSALRISGIALILKGGWLFLEANLGVSEGRYHCVLWSEPRRTPIWYSISTFDYKEWVLDLAFICYEVMFCFWFFGFFLPKIQQNFLLVSASLGWFMEMLRVPSSRRQHLQQWDIFRESLLLIQETREWPQQMGQQCPVTTGSAPLAFAEPPSLRLSSPEHTDLHGWGKKWDIVLWVEIIYGHS